MTTMQTPEDGRGERLQVRVSNAQKSMLQQAASLSRRSLSDFVLASAQEAAAKVIEQNQVIQLSREDQIAFVTALLDPPEPGPRLRQAAAAYRQRVGL